MTRPKAGPASHCCPIPVNGRKHWWTCPTCGQLWRKVDGFWKLSAREADTAGDAR